LFCRADENAVYIAVEVARLWLVPKFMEVLATRRRCAATRHRHHHCRRAQLLVDRLNVVAHVAYSPRPRNDA